MQDFDLALRRMGGHEDDGCVFLQRHRNLWQGLQIQDGRLQLAQLVRGFLAADRIHENIDSRQSLPVVLDAVKVIEQMKIITTLLAP